MDPFTVLKRCYFSSWKLLFICCTIA